MFTVNIDEKLNVEAGGMKKENTRGKEQEEAAWEEKQKQEDQVAENNDSHSRGEDNSKKE